MKFEQRAKVEKKSSARLPDADLVREWYARLKLSGFRDIEFVGQDGTVLQTVLRESVGSLRREYRPDSEFYYRKAQWYFHHTPSLKGAARAVWDLHSQGLTNPAIARELGMAVGSVKNHVVTVRAKFFRDDRYERAEAEDIAMVAEARGFKLDE